MSSLIKKQVCSSDCSLGIRIAGPRQRPPETAPRLLAGAFSPNSTRAFKLPIEWTRRLAGSLSRTRTEGSLKMGKGNNSQKNDKKTMKPKKDKTKPAAKK
jgi:hypothetical protein